MTTLTDAFVSNLAPPLVVQARAVSDLDHRLRELVAAGSRAWGELGPSPETFVAHAARLIPADATVDAFFAQVIAEDLFLACGCTERHEAAVAALEKRYGAQIDGALSVLKHDFLQADDLRQIVRDKLYVGAGTSPPAISRYNGLGTLGGWLRVIAMRTGLNAVRKKGPGVTHAPDVEAFVPALADPELDYLKDTYRESFKEAFLLAVAELSGRERTLLRQSAVHRLSVREIGRMYGVHYATASRWIADARNRLADKTRAELAQRLGLSPEQLDSIMRLIQSRIDVSLAAVLGDSSNPKPQ